jgi:peptidoglycan biosynthesis protein MviN/MurJ (putative lipid II flippase)
VTVLNSLIARLLWVFLGPLRDWPPLAGLTVVSLLVAMALLVIIKFTSNQRALADTKRQILASLFELRLFQDDPRLMLRATGGLLRQQGRYLAYAFVPVLVAFVPITLLLLHLQAYYGPAIPPPSSSG